MKRLASRRLALVLAVSVISLAAGCDQIRARRLRGTWESETLPKRRLELSPDGTYSRRLSGKTLGFLSDLTGPERGTWKVEGESLVLAAQASVERSERLAIRDLATDSCWLGGEKWQRVAPSPSSP